ncbi:30S ribosomal protein S6 [candidate division KSB1 bacterium]
MTQYTRQYESIIIVNSSLREDTLNRIIARCEDIITKKGGKLIETERWGKRRLAYPIKKFQYGFYIIFHIEAPSDLIPELEREYRLNENILRFMSLVKDARAIRVYKERKEHETEEAEKSASKKEAITPKTAEAGKTAVSEETKAEVEPKTGEVAAATGEPETAAQEEPENTAAGEKPEPEPASDATVEDSPEIPDAVSDQTDSVQEEPENTAAGEKPEPEPASDAIVEDSPEIPDAASDQTDSVQEEPEETPETETDTQQDTPGDEGNSEEKTG